MMQGLLSIPKWFAVIFSCALASGFAAFCRVPQNKMPLAWLPTALLVVFLSWALYEHLHRRNETGSWAMLASGTAATPTIWACFALIAEIVLPLGMPHDLNLGKLLCGAIVLVLTTLVTVWALHYSRRGSWLGACAPMILLFLVSGFIWFVILEPWD